MMTHSAASRAAPSQGLTEKAKGASAMLRATKGHEAHDGFVQDSSNGFEYPPAGHFRAGALIGGTAGCLRFPMAD
jgi:hypothetical protein